MVVRLFHSYWGTCVRSRGGVWCCQHWGVKGGEGLCNFILATPQLLGIDPRGLQSSSRSSVVLTFTMLSLSLSFYAFLSLPPSYSLTLGISYCLSSLSLPLFCLHLFLPTNRSLPINSLLVVSYSIRPVSFILVWSLSPSFPYSA